MVFAFTEHTKLANLITVTWIAGWLGGYIDGFEGVWHFVLLQKPLSSEKASG